MTAILLRRERGRNNAEMYAVLVVTPPPLFSAKLRFKRGGVTTREYGIYGALGKQAPRSLVELRYQAFVGALRRGE